MTTLELQAPHRKSSSRLSRRLLTRCTRRACGMGTSPRCTSGRHGGRWRRRVRALIATLLPDPGDAEKRKALLERMAGRIVEKIERQRLNGAYRREGKGSHRGRHPPLGPGERPRPPVVPTTRYARLTAGCAPRVLDPFAGGGAIPLEAMRLGCEVTAMDINPVAWFILKCTLEYPQRLAGQTRPLPAFAVEQRGLHGVVPKGQGLQGRPPCRRSSKGSDTATERASLMRCPRMVQSRRLTSLGTCAHGAVGS